GGTSVRSFLATSFSIAAANAVFTLVRAFGFAYGGLQAARVLHRRLLTHVLRKKTRFFDVTPSGRVVNRFSRDAFSVDEDLPFHLNVLLAQARDLLDGYVGGAELYQSSSDFALFAAWSGLRQTAEVLPGQQPRAEALRLHIQVSTVRAIFRDVGWSGDHTSVPATGHVFPEVYGSAGGQSTRNFFSVYGLCVAQSQTAGVGGCCDRRRGIGRCNSRALPTVTPWQSKRRHGSGGGCRRSERQRRASGAQSDVCASHCWKSHRTTWRPDGDRTRDDFCGAHGRVLQG
ncbi:unnamed protein product, partial [Sphacelaria rigidula]